MSLEVLRNSTSFTSTSAPQISDTQPLGNTDEQMDTILKQLKRRLRERITKDVPNKHEFQVLLERLNQTNATCPKLQSQLLVWSIQLLNGGKSSLTTMTIPSPTSPPEKILDKSYPPVEILLTPTKVNPPCVPHHPTTPRYIPIVEVPTVSQGNILASSSSECPPIDEPFPIQAKDQPEVVNFDLHNQRRKIVEVVIANEHPQKHQKIQHESTPVPILVASHSTSPVHFEIEIPAKVKKVKSRGSVNKPYSKILNITEQSRSQTGKILYRVTWLDGSQSWESPRDMASSLDLIEKFEHDQYRRLDSSGRLTPSRRRITSRQQPAKEYLVDQSIADFKDLSSHSEGPVNPSESELLWCDVSKHSQTKPLDTFICVEIC
ncbi:hypothetical protein K7432_014157 [Basidiobolus ranarum]|uniref:Chromo domain-containing protein n=1 Tax=Basidiobolus ranarum TaxID=34480 RepID=A0ABR2WI11_9FUNG